MALGRREAKRLAAREAVIGAASAMFDGKGFDATRIDEIAAAADVAVGTVYTHFGAKADLLVAVLRDDVASVLARAFDIARAASPSPVEKTIALAELVLNTMEGRPRRLWREIFGNAALDEKALKPAFEEALAQLRAVVHGVFNDRDRADAAFGIAFAVVYTYVLSDALSVAEAKRRLRRQLRAVLC